MDVSIALFGCPPPPPPAPAYPSGGGPAEEEEEAEAARAAPRVRNSPRGRSEKNRGLEKKLTLDGAYYNYGIFEGI